MRPIFHYSTLAKMIVTGEEARQILGVTGIAPNNNRIFTGGVGSKNDLLSINITILRNEGAVIAHRIKKNTGGGGEVTSHLIKSKSDIVGGEVIA